MGTENNLSVGDRAEIVVHVNDDFIARFAEFSGDDNPLHLDSDFADTTPFKRRVAHGMSYGAIFSRLVGTRIPGPGALWASQSFEFRKPVFVNDNLTLSVEIIEANSSTRTFTLKCEARNQHGYIVMTGTGTALTVEQEIRESKDVSPKKSPLAVVTGGTRGIGLAICNRLSEDGYRIATTYRSSEEHASGFRNNFPESLCLKSDVGNQADTEKTIDQILQRMGTPDVLVINAGGEPLYGDSADGDFSRFASQIERQLAGTHRLASGFLPHMSDRGSGAVIGIGSVFSEGVPPVGMTPYVVAKSALTAYLKCLAVEYGPKGIRCNIVSPGITETSLAANIPDRQRKVAAAQTPLRRLAMPEDIANAVAYLASPEAGFVSGHTLTVSGGVNMK
ncbi:MAG: SDR family oxidoreductase [Alphaproteobacteria bacterium]|nr:SDR family oxidoreductase [Alphaproteobacteria bacterium]